MMDSIDFWHWFIASIVLIILEVFAPGAFFLWMGVAAAVVGATLWMFPDMSWESQFLVFSIFSVVSIALWRIRLRKHPTESEDSTLNSRTMQYVGRVFTLEAPITNGYGQIHVDDTFWKVRGPDCAAGTKIKVIATDGMILDIEPDN